MTSPCILRPSDILRPTKLEEKGKTRSPKRRTLLILNRPLENLGLERFLTLWNSCDYVVCADGAANRLLYLVQRYLAGWENYLPNAIVGDLDSIDSGVRKLYESTNKVKIIHDPDQYSTDFGKSIEHILENTSTSDIVILGALGGRVDQCLGLYHELYRETKRLQSSNTSVRLWLVQDSSLSFLLSPGRGLIKNVGPISGLYTEMAGILPLYGPANITIEGFEWDVQNWPTEMGSNVSTSNHIRAEDIVIETDHPVLFTVELVGGAAQQQPQPG